VRFSGRVVRGDDVAGAFDARRRNKDRCLEESVTGRAVCPISGCRAKKPTTSRLIHNSFDREVANHHF
jgi:hypothetical protein